MITSSSLFKDPAYLALSRPAKHIYLVLRTYADQESGKCFPSIPTLSSSSGVYRGCVRSAIAELQKKGLIHLESEGNGFRRYYNVTGAGNRPGRETDRVGNTDPTPPVNQRGPLQKTTPDHIMVKSMSVNPGASSEAHGENIHHPILISGNFEEYYQRVGDFYRSLNGTVEEWEKDFPLVNVRKQIYDMCLWFKANPHKRRSRLLKFSRDWLGREQKRAEYKRGRAC